MEVWDEKSWNAFIEICKHKRKHNKVWFEKNKVETKTTWEYVLEGNTLIKKKTPLIMIFAIK